MRRSYFLNPESQQKSSTQENSQNSLTADQSRSQMISPQNRTLYNLKDEQEQVMLSSKKFKFREFNTSENSSTGAKLSNIKRIGLSPKFNTASQLYYQFLTNSPSIEGKNTVFTKTSAQFSPSQFNLPSHRKQQPKEFDKCNTFLTSVEKKEIKFSEYENKTPRSEKILNFNAPKPQKKELLYPYLSKKEQQAINENLSKQRLSLEKQRQIMSLMVKGNERYPQSSKEIQENNQIPMSRKSKASFHSKSVQGSYSRQQSIYQNDQSQENFELFQKEQEEEIEDYEQEEQSSFHSILESPLSPPPEKCEVLQESKMRRTMKDSPIINRKSFWKLKPPPQTSMNSFDPNRMKINLQSLNQGITSITAFSPMHTGKISVQNIQSASPMNSCSTPFSSVMTSTSIYQNNNFINNTSPFNIQQPFQRNKKIISLQVPSKQNEQIVIQNKENRSQSTNEVALMETREEKEEEDENGSVSSYPSNDILLKRKFIEEQSKSQIELANMYQTSYKNISQIIEENKFFKIKNSIEEDMLSSTLSNSILMPRRLGVLGSLKSSKALGKQAEEEAQANGFLNLILSKREQGNSKKQKLTLSRLNIGNSYVQMIAKALSHPDLSLLQSINLSYNYFDGNSVFAICNTLSETIQSIDLSNNNIGPRGTKGLIPLFDSKKYNFLRKLNLENNNISDQGLNTIIPYMSFNMSLYSLNISHNKLSDTSCSFIKKLLLNSSYLQELYLHWNKFSSYGGVLISQGLQENLNIKVLDLSHNGLGSIPKLKCGSKIIGACNVLKSAVCHLDISFNQFTFSECTEMAEVLKSNRSLYGIHMEGNQGSALIDPKGFLYFPDLNDLHNHFSDSHINIQRILGVKTKGQNKFQSFDCKSLDNCWICHGWEEVKFEITTNSSDLFTGEPAYLHLDFEDFQPMYMDRDQEDPSKYVLYRMLPPNRKVTFFFSDPCKNVIYTSKDFPIQDFQINENMNLKFEDLNSKKEKQEKNVEIKQVQPNDKQQKQQQQQQSQQQQKQPQAKGKQQAQNQQKKNATKIEKSSNNISLPHIQKEIKPSDEAEELENDAAIEALDEMNKAVAKKFKLQYLDETIIQYHTPTYVNYVLTGASKEIICKKKDYEPNIRAIPRQTETFFRISKINSWHRGVSLFRDYIPDSDELDKRCFEQDWISSKLPKILEKAADMEECKKIIGSVYPLMRIAYKYLSSQSAAGDVFCITQNPFSTFAQKAQLIDNVQIFIRDIDFNFISASNIALKAKTYRNPDKALIRNEFMEVLGRIALDKYVRNDKSKTNLQAVELFFNEQGLINHLYEYDSPQQWRNQRYWNKECDHKLKEQLPFLKTLYNTIADSRKNEKRYFTTVKSMSMQEFKDMVLKYDILDDQYGERDIPLVFNLSMMTQVDELNSDRYFQMTFVEFLEALARIAEKKSLTPLGEIPETYTLEERIQIKLHFKIESFITYMKKKYELFVLKERQQSTQPPPLPQQAQASQKGDGKKLMAVLSALKQQRQGEIAPTNFLKNLAQQSNEIEEFEKDTQQAKNHLKDIIHKIIHKDIIVPPKNIPQG